MEADPAKNQVIAVSSKSGGATGYISLKNDGTSEIVPNIEAATRMSFDVAWCVLRLIQKDYDRPYLESHQLSIALAA